MSHKKTAESRSGKVVNLLLVLILLVGIGLLAYPSVSDWWNAKVQSRMIVNYSEAVDSLEEKDYDALFAAAEAYNRRLAKKGSLTMLAEPDTIAGYEKLLDITGTGILGYITIDKLNAQLPIYHGTSEAVLNIAAGHLQGSSLPVGGSSTHSVLSAHRGLPTAKLFTDLDKLVEGDTFYITILDRTFTYMVDQISIILPNELEKLLIEPEKDFCTLMTCTPYGINTHRLLVRGHRIENDDTQHIYVKAEAYRLDSIFIAPVLAAVMMLILMIIVAIKDHHAKRKKKKKMNMSITEAPGK